MTQDVQFDSGDDFTTRALMARARGEKVDAVLPPEEVQNADAEKPAQIQPPEQLQAA